MSEILFAEDDADIRKWVAVALETEGYAVRTVPDGEAALAAREYELLQIGRASCRERV